jgi:uncharacterized membrane protein YphA (DoxX/SURF4 family)
MMIRILDTDASTLRFAQRILLAAVIFPHGAQKLFGWFGGPGLDRSMELLTAGVGLPWFVAVVVVLAESVGALALAAGLLSRLTALGIAAVMTGAILTVHLRNGFLNSDLIVPKEGPHQCPHPRNGSGTSPCRSSSSARMGFSVTTGAETATDARASTQRVSEPA